jgi:hypothetical protein
MLDAASTPIVSQWLRSLVDRGVPVVLTCRSFEFRTQLEPLSERAPLLATLVDRKEIHRLSLTETTDFATAYLRAQPDTDRSLTDRFVERLLHLRAQRQAVVEVCGNPLLLALACRLYAPTGKFQ